jgi:HK97 family phage portal protein
MSRRNRNRPQPQSMQLVAQQKADPNVAVVVQNQGVGTPATMPRNMRAYIQEGYRSSKTVFRVVGHIARAGAGIKWKHYTDETKKREITSPNDELMMLWKNPAPKVAGAQFREAMIAYYALTGNSYLLGINASQNPTAKFDELYNLRPDLTKIKADENGPLYYEFGNFSPPRRYPEAFVMHNKLFAGNDDIYGMSPVEVAAMLIDVQKAGQKWNLGLLNNMARPGGAWVTDALLDNTSYKNLKEEIRKKFAGPRNAGETAILHGGVKWQSMSMSPYELDWLESDAKGDKDIAGIFFNFPIPLLGMSDTTFNNLDEAKRFLYTDIVFPIMDMFEDSLNMWIVPRYGGYLGYDRDDVETIADQIKAAKAQDSDRAAAEFTGGTTTFFEAREIQGKPKLTVKDFIIINQVPVHIEDLDEYIEAMAGKTITPPAPPPMLPPPTLPNTTVTEVPNQDDTNPPQKLLLPSPAEELKVLDLHTAAEKAAYFKTVESQRTKWEKVMKGRLESYFGDEHKTIAAAINRGSADSAQDNVAHALTVLEQQGSLKHLIVSLYQDVGTDSGESVIKDLKYGQKPFETKDSFDLNLYAPDVLVYLLSMAGTKVTQINAYTQALLQSALEEGVADGESIPQLVKRIDDLYLFQTTERIQTIVATEVAAANNYGSHEAALASDLSLNKVWLATPDGHTRPDHRAADGQTVGMDEPFEVGGQQLMYPGDISLGAGAEEIVNCFPGDTLVAAQGIQAATKRWYEGELVEITTSLGHKLAGTPNHPILTNRGWVRLGSLVEGDSVISGAFSKEMSFSDPNVENVPTPISEVYDAISNTGYSERVTGSDMDFHGDGMHGNIEIIFRDGKLRHTSIAPVEKPLHEYFFPIADFAEVSLGRNSLSVDPVSSIPGLSGSRGFSHSNPLFFTGSAHSEVVSFRAVAGADISDTQNAVYDLPRDIELSSKSLDGSSILIERSNLTGNPGIAVIGSVSGGNTLILENGSSSLFDTEVSGHGSHIQDFANFLKTFTGLVQLTSITKVVRRAFSGHVYNLQTDSSVYISNSIITHNCRCTQYYERVPGSSLDDMPVDMPEEMSRALNNYLKSLPQTAISRDHYRELLRAKR